MDKEALIHFLAGAAGGTAGTAITCPLEVIKTRLQSSTFQMNTDSSGTSSTNSPSTSKTPPPASNTSSSATQRCSKYPYSTTKYRLQIMNLYQSKKKCLKTSQKKFFRRFSLNFLDLWNVFQISTVHQT